MFAHTIKHGLHLFRRVFHVTRVFIFQSDKTLEEGYSPSYRYLPIVSGVVVPVRNLNVLYVYSDLKFLQFSILLEIPGLTVSVIELLLSFVLKFSQEHASRIYIYLIIGI